MINFQAQSRFAVLVLTAIAVIVCSRTGCQPQKQAGPPEKVTIAYPTIFNAVLVHIAFAKDYFAQEGLEATPQPHAFGKPVYSSKISK